MQAPLNILGRGILPIMLPLEILDGMYADVWAPPAWTLEAQV